MCGAARRVTLPGKITEPCAGVAAALPLGPPTMQALSLSLLLGSAATIPATVEEVELVPTPYGMRPKQCARHLGLRAPRLLEPAGRLTSDSPPPRCHPHPALTPL